MKILTELVIFIVKKVIEARLVCFDYFFCFCLLKKCRLLSTENKLRF